MFRTSILALAAVATLGVTAISTANDASAKGFKGGWHGGFHHRHFGHGYGYGFGVVGLAAADCYQVITRRGFVRTICD